MEKEDASSTEFLLNSHDACNDGISLENRRDKSESWGSWWKKNVFFLAISCLLFYIACLETVRIGRVISVESATSASPSDDQLSLIPQGMLRYEQRPEWRPVEAPWNTPPSPQLDDFWEEFLHASNIRVTQEELSYLNENLTDLVQVNNGDYAGILGVFHHLHCLNNLRKIVHWDYYGPINPNPGESLSKTHSDHCIDSIRQALMCHANTAIYTVQWLNDTKHPLNKDLKSTKHATCVNWESLDVWARERALVPGTYHYLSGPYPANTVMTSGSE